MYLQVILTFLWAIGTAALTPLPYSLNQERKIKLPNPHVAVSTKIGVRDLYGRLNIQLTNVLPRNLQWKDAHRLAKRGNCLGQICSKTPKRQSRSPNAAVQHPAGSVRGSLAMAESVQDMPTLDTGSPRRPRDNIIVISGRISSQGGILIDHRPPSSSASRRAGRPLPMEDFGTRLRRAKERESLIQSASEVEHPTEQVHELSKGLPIRSGSRASSLGAESIEAKNSLSERRGSFNRPPRSGDSSSSEKGK